jgi:ATP-dependent DNA helicase DinG
MFPFRFRSKRATSRDVNALAPALDLAPALVVLPGGRCAVADAVGGREIGAAEARGLFEGGPILIVHAGMTAQRLGVRTPPRSPRLLDALELWAFVRPAKFCAPSAAGLIMAAGH